MGTIISKLSWLLYKKAELVDKIKTKFTRTNQSWSGLEDENSSLERIDSALNALTRRRLVPVITMYMLYSYGSLDGVAKYAPLKRYSSSISWLNSIIDKNRCMYDVDDIWDTTGQAPILSRQAQGVIVGTMPTHKYNAVYNQPFVMGVGIEGHMSNKTVWDVKTAYASLSYIYSSGSIKILLADDATNNDGAFILGNIALVDPLTHPEVRDDFMVQLVNTHINTPSTFPQLTHDYFGDFTFQNSGVNITTVRINHGYNEYSYIWPVVVGALHSANPKPPITATIKSVQVYASYTNVVVATGRDAKEHREGFRLMVYGKK